MQCLSRSVNLPSRMYTKALFIYPVVVLTASSGPHSQALGSILRSAVCQDTSLTNKAAVQPDLGPGWSFVLGLLGLVRPPVPAGASEAQAQQRPLMLPEDLLGGESTPSPGPWFRVPAPRSAWLLQGDARIGAGL